MLEGLQLRVNTLLFFFHGLTFGKLKNNRLNHHFQCSNLPYGLWSSHYTIDLSTVVADRIIKEFNMFGTTQPVAFDIYQIFKKSFL